MKYLAGLLLLIPTLSFGQLVKFDFKGYREHECINFVITQFAKKNDSVVCKLADSLLKPNIHTIYIMKMPYLKEVPDSVNGYAIKVIDFDNKANAKLLYQAQHDDNGIILHVSNMLNKYAFWTVWVMPMKAEKHFLKKPKVVFDKVSGFKATFFYNDANGTFTFDKTECL